MRRAAAGGGDGDDGARGGAGDEMRDERDLRAAGLMAETPRGFVGGEVTVGFAAGFYVVPRWPGGDGGAALAEVLADMAAEGLGVGFVTSHGAPDNAAPAGSPVAGDVRAVVVGEGGRVEVRLLANRALGHVRDGAGDPTGFACAAGDVVAFQAEVDALGAGLGDAGDDEVVPVSLGDGFAVVTSAPWPTDRHERDSLARRKRAEGLEAGGANVALVSGPSRDGTHELRLLSPREATLVPWPARGVVADGAGRAVLMRRGDARALAEALGRVVAGRTARCAN